MIVLAGKDKGKRGKIIQTLPEDGKVIIDGINVVTRHQKSRSSSSRAMVKQQLGEIQVPLGVNIAKVMLICPKCNKETRMHRVRNFGRRYGASVPEVQRDGGRLEESCLNTFATAVQRCRVRREVMKMTFGHFQRSRRMVRLKDKYSNETVPALMKQFEYKNIMQVPRLAKVVVSMGVGQSIQEPKLLDAAVNDMTLITGQKPAITRAKKSISNFKLREGMRIGCKVTLRGAIMFEFLDRLFNVVLPRVRDFGGIAPESFDGRGNFGMGLKEQLVFPEVDYDKIDRVRGMNIVIATTAKTDEEAQSPA